MDKIAILEAIKDLARSQDFYCHVYDYIVNNAYGEIFFDKLEKQNFSDVLDLVLYLEN